MALFQKKVIKNLDQTQEYLVRYSLRLPFGWSVKVHQILLSDGDRCRHSHPWIMIRVILKGGYTEEVGPGKFVELKPWRPWYPFRMYYAGWNFQHRIHKLTNGPNWSLVLMGPKKREWGFFVKGGWMHWKKFLSGGKNRIDWCE